MADQAGFYVAHRMRKVLERRFGPLSDELRAALQTADENTLMNIVANIVAHLAAETLDDVKKRLGVS